MKSRFRSGRGISATPDTVRSAVSGRRSSATAARYPAQYQARGRIPPPGTAADASPARAASGRTVFRPGDRMPVRHSTRTFSTHSYAQGTGTSLETEVVLPSRTHAFATNALQFVYFHKKPVQIPLRRLEQTAVESERSSMHAVYGARTEQHLPLLRLQIGNPLLESAKPTLQILHTYYNQSGGRTLFAASGEAKIKK